LPRARRPFRNAGEPPLTAEQVVELATRHNLAELEIEQGGVRIRVVRERGSPAPVAPAREEVSAAAPRALPAEAATHLIPVEAPMVGTFYRAPGPDAAPYVSEGDVVKEGQVLCIIEAMKLMNEIEARAPGRVAKILVENAQPVEYGQPLFLLEPR